MTIRLTTTQYVELRALDYIEMPLRLVETIVVSFWSILHYKV